MNFKMETDSDAIIVTIPVGRMIGQIVKEQELRVKHLGYTTRKKLGGGGIYLTCKKRGRTQQIYIKENPENPNNSFKNQISL